MRGEARGARREAQLRVAGRACGAKRGFEPRGAALVVHREPDPEARPVLNCVAGEEAVRLEEALGVVPQVGVAQETRLDQLAQGLRALLVRHLRRGHGTAVPQEQRWCALEGNEARHTSLRMPAVASRKLDSHLASAVSAVESGGAVESGLAERLKVPNADSGEPTVDRPFAAGWRAVRSERINGRVLLIKGMALVNEGVVCPNYFCRNWPNHVRNVNPWARA